jgi:predicted peroxiredoxin
MGHVMVHNTHGEDDIERASLAFVVANTALNSNQQATVLLTIEGVWVATRGYADGLQAHGFGPGKC